MLEMPDYMTPIWNHQIRSNPSDLYGREPQYDHLELMEPVEIEDAQSG